MIEKNDGNESNATLKTYRKPKLVEFGDVSRLTHADIDGIGIRDNDTDRNLKEMS